MLESHTDVKEAWCGFRNTLLSVARDTLPRSTVARRPWMSPSTLEILTLKHRARQTGDIEEALCLGVFSKPKPKST